MTVRKALYRDSTTGVVSEVPAGDSVAGSAITRSTVAFTTGSLVNNGYEAGSVTIGRTFSVIKLSLSATARLELYSTAAQRDADVARAIGTLPTPGSSHGLIGDWYLDGTTGFSLSNFICSPEAGGSNADSSPASTIYYTVTNKSGATAAITATLTVLIEEA